MSTTGKLGPFSVGAIGLGAMRLAGPNVFGPPANYEEAVAVLRASVELGVNHIDTAQCYGPKVVNELIREALAPFPPELVLVSKVGAARGRRGEIFADDEPDRLRLGIEDNLRTLGTDRLGVVNLRLTRSTDPDAFFDDQLAVMIRARNDGLIAGIGLSNVSRSHLQRALEATEIVCVQNALHLGDRNAQSVLDECTRRRMAFVPFAPLGFGSSSVLAAPGLLRVPKQLTCTLAQVCLAWLLAISPVMLLIPGTSSLRDINENVAADLVHLDKWAIQEISRL